MAAKLTTEIIQRRIDDSTTVNLYVLEPYTGAKIKFLVRCETCLTEKYTTWNSINNSISSYSTGCNTCSRTKLPKQYIKELKGRNITVLEPYINNKTKIKHQCYICSNIWYVTPTHILTGRGCSNCYNKKRTKTHKEYTAELKGRNITVLEPYITARVKIQHKCNICENVWKAQPNDILRGTGCPPCALVSRCKQRTKTHEAYTAELKDRNLSVLEPYVNAGTKIKHQCNICENVWKAQPTNILTGTGCPTCALVMNQIHWNKERTPELKQTASKIPCSLYILESKECIKIGISTNTIGRVKSLNYEGFICTLIHEFESNVWDAIMLEQDIHREFKRYYTAQRFNGYTELHYKKDLEDIVNYINKQINY